MKTYWQKQNASKETQRHQPSFQSVKGHRGLNVWRLWDKRGWKSLPTETKITIILYCKWFFFPYQNNMKASFLFFKFLPRKCSQLKKQDERTWVFTVLFFNYSTNWVFQINSRVGYEGSGAQHGWICTFSKVKWNRNRYTLAWISVLTLCVLEGTKDFPLGCYPFDVWMIFKC